MSWEKELKEYDFYIRLEKKLSDNSIEAYLRDLNQMIEFMTSEFGVGSGADVKPEQVESFMASLYDRKASKTTQGRVLSGIKSFFNFLLINDKIETLPTEFTDTPKIGRHLPDVLSQDEIASLMNSIDMSNRFGCRNRAMIETLYSCGLRVSELVTLRLNDLFFNDGFIRVIGKGDKQRLVPVGEIAVEYINAYLEQRLSLDTGSQIDILFLNNRGRELTRVMVFHIIKKLAIAAGITKNISPHTFRHSFATHLLEGGASIRQVQEMLGHESILTTEIYTHLDTTRLHETIGKYHPLSKLR